MSRKVSKHEMAVAHEVLRAIPRHTRREVGLQLHISKAQIHLLVNQLLGGRKLLSDWDVEILKDRKTKPGPEATVFRKKVAQQARELQAEFERMAAEGAP